MRYIADLHVHSKYSRATSRNLDLEHLYIFAQIKGINVVATGDFTHPAWFAELSGKLVPAEEGFFRLADDIAAACDREVPAACRGPVRFVLATEISNIYKKNGVTRKNHNLVFMPGLEEAARFNARLDAIGNIKADGRPILGLDARDLLEIALEVSEAAYLIPAHVWTPWFSVFGSKSGFDSLRECFEDLTPHIFALETGLSSDPAMNWQVSGIDGLTLVSNSDAHSPGKLGREACLFDTELSYGAMRSALATGDPRRYLGTYEFYPEEGKYHYDGHRKCGICWHPEETLKNGGICPVCGQSLTLGVLYRVAQLADRPEGIKPARHHPYHSIIPLEEMLSEILGVGPKTKKVAAAYHQILEKFGSEFKVLYAIPEEDLKLKGIALLDEAIGRMRQGRINLDPGYDGEYGQIRVFEKGEKDQLRGQRNFFVPDDPPPPPAATNCPPPSSTSSGRESPGPSLAGDSPAEASDGEAEPLEGDVLSGLNFYQRQAAVHQEGPLMIMAGPGSGKTRTITCRMARLIRDGLVESRAVLAITFTNRAAGEMRQRLTAMMGAGQPLPLVTTFHAFCLGLLRDWGEAPRLILDDNDQLRLVAGLNRQMTAASEPPGSGPSRLLDLICRAKQNLLRPEDDPGPLLGTSFRGLRPDRFRELYRAYQDALGRDNACDYEDLVARVVCRLSEDKALRLRLQRQYQHVLIDEYQDVNYCQYRLVQLLAPADGNVCVIGDPDQAIYGFRGSDAAFFQRFERDFPGATRIGLDKNYRSTDTILSASYNVVSRQGDDNQRLRVYSGLDGGPAITVAGLASDRAEAVYVGKTIEQMVGGLGFHSMDFGATGYDEAAGEYSFSDMAVLFRTRRQADVFAEVFGKAGIPCHLVSRESLFDSPGVAELISWLRLCEDKGSFFDFERVAGQAVPPVRAQTMAVLDAWRNRHDFSVEAMMAALVRFPVDRIETSVQRVLADLVETVWDLREDMRWMRLSEKISYLREVRPEIGRLIKGHPRRREALDRVMARAVDAGEQAESFFDSTALTSDTDDFVPRADRVRLMTIHAAKGLEFPVVFVAGCEDGLIPLAGSGENEIDPDEERRLLYVAMTRAGSELIFTWAQQRMVYGKLEKRRLSSFVADIQGHLLKSQANAGKRKKPGQGAVQLELF
ncbi:MAG: UvrD-helicase domain-containing protein [Desulfosudaceae bacterium]